MKDLYEYLKRWLDSHKKKVNHLAEIRLEEGFFGDKIIVDHPSIDHGSKFTISQGISGWVIKYYDYESDEYWTAKLVVVEDESGSNRSIVKAFVLGKIVTKSQEDETEE